MADSPALNPLSRQVLVPLARPSLPQAVHITGPGPVEPTHRADTLTPSGPDKPTPAVPQHLIDDVEGEGEGGDSGDAGGIGHGYSAGGDAEDEDEHASKPLSSDPYAGLASAFGSGGASNGGGKGKGKGEDLLF